MVDSALAIVSAMEPVMHDVSTLQIHTAREEERKAAAALTVAAYTQYAAVMPAQAWGFYRQNMIDTVMNSKVAGGGAGALIHGSVESVGDHAPEPFELIVAERNGALVGSVLYTPSMGDAPNSAYFRLLAVAPDARGQGIGKALTQECLRRARAAGATSMLLNTTDMMDVAQNMYVRMGFVRAPEFDFRVPVDTKSGADDELIKGYRLDLS